MTNVTSTSTFLLLEFTDVRNLQILYFFALLGLYLVAVSCNLIITILIIIDHHLHSPMYFFLMNLGIMDIGSISVMVPKAMFNSLMNTRSISYSGCIVQVFFFFAFLTADFALLTIMAHDRYVAICNPLQYESIMHKGACIQMVISAWISGILNASLHTGGTFAVTFCSNVVNQFFCEVPQLLKIACSDLYLVEVGFIVFSASIMLGCFMFITVTYMKIFATVFKIPSVQGQKKALSTCLPHLTVVSLLVFSGVFAYARPPSNASSHVDVLGFAVIYTVMSPLLNPLIYSMRNKEIKNALLKLFHLGCFSKIIFSRVVL